MDSLYYSDGNHFDFVDNLYIIETRGTFGKCPCGLKDCSQLLQKFEEAGEQRRNVHVRVTKIKKTEPEIVKEMKRHFRRCVCEALNAKEKKDTVDITIAGWHFHPDVLRTNNCKEGPGPYCYITDETKAAEIYKSTDEYNKNKVTESTAVKGSWFVLPNYSREMVSHDLNLLMNTDSSTNEAENENTSLYVVSSGSSGDTIATRNESTPRNEDTRSGSSFDEVLQKLFIQHGSQQKQFHSKDPLRFYTTKAMKALFRNVAIGLLDSCASSLMPNVEDRHKRMETLVTILSDEVHGDEHKIHNIAGEAVFEVLREKDTSRERRQFMSLVCAKGVKRQDIVKVIGGGETGVPKRLEWREARKHRRYPGIGAPYERISPIFRKKCNEAVLDNFLGWCYSNGMFQNVAFGHKICTYENGKHVIIPSVKLTSTTNLIIREFYKDYMKQLEGINDGVDNDEILNVNEGLSNDITTADNVFIESSDNDDDIRDWSGCISDDDDDDDDDTVDSTDSETAPNDSSTKNALDSRGIGYASLMRDDERCEAIDPKSRMPCLKKKNHLGKHRYTPKGYPSPSAIERLLGTITDGTIKSLAGLDNDHVVKGHDNFIKMESLVDCLSSVGGLDSIESQQRTVLLKSKIEDTKAFYKRDFAEHLNINLEDKDDSPSCTCVKCGMHHPNYPVECPIRRKEEGKGGHSKPCKDCQKGFEIIMDLYDLHDEVKSIIEEDPTRKDNGILLDDLESWKAEIDTVQENLRDFRAHLCQKEDEAVYEANMQRNLKEGEALVVCDYKMKILPAQFREPQKNYFGKRGFSCLGFMLILPSKEDKEDEVNVEYHFMLSKDTTQDAHAVLCAKDAFYNLLKKKGVNKVHFQADGAGCFKGNVSKAASINWMDMVEGIVEKSYKISVAGCGKSNLDGMFGILTQHLQRLVNSGQDYQTAEDLYHLVKKYPLKSSYFHLFEPDRSFSYTTDAKKLSDYFLLIYMEADSDSDHEEPYTIAKIHSRHGDGIIHTKQELSLLQATADKSKSEEADKGQEENEDDVVEDQTSKNRRVSRSHLPPVNQVNTSLHNASIVSPMNEDEEQFNFSSPTSALITAQKERLSFESSNECLHKYIIDSTYRESNNDNQSKHSLISHQTRKNQQINDRIGIANTKLSDRIEKKHDEMIASGLYCCDEKNEIGEYCRETFITEKYLNRHKQKGVHSFPSRSTLASVIKRAEKGAIWSSGGDDEILNISKAVKSKLVISHTEAPPLREHTSVEKDWFTPGCYCKIRQKGTTRAAKLSTAMKIDLEKLFCQGESSDSGAKPNASKYTPEEAFATLTNMTENNRRKYSPLSKNGPVPSIARIRAWFSGRARGTIQPFTDDGDPYNDKSKKELVGKCEELNLPTKGKAVLVRLMEMNDSVNGLSSDLGDYHSKTVKVLSNLCEERELPNKPSNVEALRRLLRLHDEIEARRTNVDATNDQDSDTDELDVEPFNTGR